MIALLLRVLGQRYAGPVRRAVVLMTVTAIAEGASYAFMVPVLRELLGSDPGAARPWLAVFAAAVMRLRRAALSQRSGRFPSTAPRCCAAPITGSAIIWPGCRSAGTAVTGSARYRCWPAGVCWKR